MKKIISTLILTLTICAGTNLFAKSDYFHSGNGKLTISSGSGAFSGTYKNPDGTYNEEALRKINRIFQTSYDNPKKRESMRLIEFLDYLEDTLKPGAKITIASGYRSPKYNTTLRDRGKLAAKASLHQYSMACDARFEGLSSEEVWNYIKNLKFGGAGFYHGGLVHVDVGPARSWDETTSGVGTDISDDNKLITIITDKDIYIRGDKVDMRFTRMTAFPIGVSNQFVLEREERSDNWRKVADFNPTFDNGTREYCPKFSDIDSMSGITFTLPKDTPAGKYRIKAKFCEKEWPLMPTEITSDAFEVQ